MHSSLTNIRIAIKPLLSIQDLDPARIKQDTESMILENLFSPLVQLDEDGGIKPALAEKFFWVGEELHFSLRRDLKTIDGLAITAEDAEFSFKRLMISRENPHGDLQTFLCPHEKIESVDDPCSGIFVKNDELILRVAKPDYKQFLLRMLVNTDFGVVPKSSCSPSKTDPKIIDLRNTSGPYYVASIDETKAIALQANPHHWLINGSTPPKATLIPLSIDEAASALTTGSIDVISCLLAEPSNTLDSVIKNEEINAFKTLPIKRFLVATTPSQLSKHSSKERLAIINIIKQAVEPLLLENGWNPAKEFFPILGEGSLTAEQVRDYDELLEKSKELKIEGAYTLGVAKRRLNFFKKALAGVHQIKLVEANQMPNFIPQDERPDFYITGTDASFYESINLISYNIAAGFFPLNQADGHTWLSKYMLLFDKQDRIKALRELHLKSLATGLFGVLAEAPYITLTRKPITYLGSTFFSGIPIWRIRTN